MFFSYIIQGSFDGHFISSSCIAYSKYSSLVTSAKPEKFSQPAVTLTYWIFLLPSMLRLTQIPYSIFNPIRSHTIRTRYFCLVKESCFSLADERKEDFVGGGGEQCMCSLAGSHFSFAQFLKLNLFFPSSRFSARFLLVTSLLYRFLDVAIHIRERT